MELSNTFTVDSPIDVTWPVLCDIERIAPCMPGARLTEVDGEIFKGEVKIKVGPINAKFKGTAEMTERDDDAHQAVLNAKGKDTGGKGNAHATITATAKSVGSGTEVTISTDLSITGKVAQFGRGALDDISTKLLGQFVDCLETKVLAGEDAGDGGDSSGSEDAASGGGGAVGGSRGEGKGGSGADEAGGSSASARGNGSGPDGAQATAGAGSPVATAPAPSPGGMPAGTAATGGAAAAGTPGASTASASGASASATPASSGGPRKIDGPEAEPIDLLDAAGGAETAKKAAGPVAAIMAVFFVIWWWRRRR